MLFLFLQKLKNKGVFIVHVKNSICFDWISFTYRKNDINYIFRLLGAKDLDFVRLSGYHGYKVRYFFDGISISVGSGRGDIWVEMTGQGCRTFENACKRSFEDLICDIIDGGELFNIARLDVAYDDFCGLLDIDLIERETSLHNYVSCFRSARLNKEFHSNAKTIYFGSCKSSIMFRIYNKAAEQKIEDECSHWIRFEMQLRDERAYNFALMYCMNDYNIGYVFSGVVNNYIRFVERSDGRIYNDDVADWWLRFVNSCDKIRLYGYKKDSFNITDVAGYVINQAGNAIDCILNAFGIDKFVDMIKQRNIKRNVKYDIALDNYYSECFKHGYGIPF